jgi:dTDP-4-amino-4,6-dideoxygalactose transaminase
MSPYKVTSDLEEALCEYTGAKYALCVNSCTAALFLAVKWCLHDWSKEVSIPRRTYVSVPQSILHAGGKVSFRDDHWRGAYQLKPLPVWDSARRFTSNMYQSGTFQCVSFSSSKILGIEQGGAILHDVPIAQDWFKKARFDGRTEGVSQMEDKFILGYHLIMLPSIAAQTLLKLYHLPKDNPDLPEIEYPDLSQCEFV